MNKKDIKKFKRKDFYINEIYERKKKRKKYRGIKNEER